VAPFKIGPDFIDPGHHTAIAGKTSINLDSWMLSEQYNKKRFASGAKGCDIAVVEGVMGLFDGIDGRSEQGSTAQMAKWLNLPVVLVVSAKGKARSAAAIVQGFENFDPDLKIAGVIFSKTGSRRHYEYLKTAVETCCKTKCLGFMPRNDKIVMPERHLGLVTSDELKIKKTMLSALSGMVRDNIDMDGLIRGLEPVEQADAEKKERTCKNGPVIAVARDRAFCFYYPDNLEILKNAGARIRLFSPLAGETLPCDASGLYLGGGYPEVFADRLSCRAELLEEIRCKSREGMPIYAECGGFMFLCKGLCAVGSGREYPMAGCFDMHVQMSERLKSLGYREITLARDTIIGRKGDVLRGHEFHYSSLKDSGTGCASDVYTVTGRAGQAISLKGYQVHNTLGSYFHIHFGSNEKCAEHFVEACRQFRDHRCHRKN
jgi:cobyrinic acid a,c-diamide synthase